MQRASGGRRPRLSLHVRDARAALRARGAAPSLSAPRPVAASAPGKPDIGRTPMFTYVTLGTNDPARAARFYDAVLGALGLERCDVSEPEWRDWHGWGGDGKETGRGAALGPCSPVHARPAGRRNGTVVGPGGARL